MYHNPWTRGEPSQGITREGNCLSNWLLMLDVEKMTVTCLAGLNKSKLCDDVLMNSRA